MMGWHWQRHQMNHVQVICNSFQTRNHASTSSLIFRGRMLFQTLNQQRQGTESNNKILHSVYINTWQR